MKNLQKSRVIQKKCLSLRCDFENRMNNGNQIERLSQEGECRNEGESSLLARASAVAQGFLEEIEALAGTTACKSVQLVRLKQWALEQGCWFSDRSLFGDFFDRGSENETYLSADGKKVIKLNDFRYADDNLTSFFERIEAHNRYFDACPYELDTYRSLSPRASKHNRGRRRK